MINDIINRACGYNKSIGLKDIFKQLSYDNIKETEDFIIDNKKNIYSAIGNSGNAIHINSEKNTVVSVASYFKPTVFDRVDFIQEYIEPFIIE